MILSEKITELRKRNGLSQEQFGDKMGVSRQAVSKWEMAQTTPDINKLMAMSELFGVPVDFLLKDEYDLSFIDNNRTETVAVKKDDKMISLEEVQEYWRAKKKSAIKIVLAICLLFISPVPGMLLTMNDNYKSGMIGMIIQALVLIAVAAMVILAVWTMSPFKHFRKEETELTYGVRSVAEEYKKDYEHTHLLGVLIGAGLILFSIIPMMVSMFFTEKILAMVLSGVLMLILLASGISLIVYVSLVNSGFSKILKIK